MKRGGLYVEIEMEAPIAKVWELTQSPEQHERWDLRFSSIQYLPKEEAEPQRFRYETRFGALGEGLDGMIFRPLMGWATAWSFDRLRLWVDRGVPPEVSLRCGIGYGLSRLAVAMVWIYQGLVPKLLGPHADELALLAAGGARADAPGVARGSFHAARSPAAGARRKKE